MAHHIVVGEVDEADAVDARKHVDRVAQPGTCSRWEIDLTEIPRHHHSRPLAEAGQKHLHLNRRGVLRLVQNDECVGERSEEHTSELQSLMRISYAVFCLKTK